MADWTLSAEERAVYRRFADLALPRHTSYPSAQVWRPDYGPDQFRCDLERSAAPARPVSIYVHIPFCEQLCYYCACTKEIVPAARRKQCDPGPAFLEGLEVEADRLAKLAETRDVRQVHLGGGSPTFLNETQLELLWQILSGHFHVAADAEAAVEVDPRITSRGQLETLRRLGFNRVSLGVQDFNPVVQRAVNRLQPFETVARLVGWCRELGFGSVNFDLIYGLPYQTAQTMAETLDQVVRLAPDRIAFYRLAVIPEMFRWQNTFSRADLPSGELSLDLNLLAINRFVRAGYEFIGLDHFARPSEELAQARRSGSLQRNFQGMTTGKGLDLLGLGPSAISQLDDAYAQNAKTTAEWEEALTSDVATVRGMHLSEDDRLRRELLQQLYGNGTVHKAQLEWTFGIYFDDYFAEELHRLGVLQDLGLVQLGPELICLTAPLGRLLVRVVAAAFDAYLPGNAFLEGLPATLASKVG